MQTDSRESNSTPGAGEQAYIYRSYMRIAFEFVLSLALGLGILVGLVSVTRSASAQQMTATQTLETRSDEGATATPDCGPNWVIVSSPNATADANVVTDVALVSSSDVWAVGAYSEDSAVTQTLTEH